MEEELLKSLKRIVDEFPDADFCVTYFDNNSFTIKEVTDENFRNKD